MTCEPWKSENFHLWQRNAFSSPFFLWSQKQTFLISDSWLQDECSVFQNDQFDNSCGKFKREPQLKTCGIRLGIMLWDFNLVTSSQRDLHTSTVEVFRHSDFGRLVYPARNTHGKTYRFKNVSRMAREQVRKGSVMQRLESSLIINKWFYLVLMVLGSSNYDFYEVMPLPKLNCRWDDMSSP